MKKTLVGLLALTLMFSCKNSEEKNKTSENEKQEVNVYTHRHYESDQELFEMFEEQTGITVNVINANADELIQKMSMEGEQSPADVLITVDAGRLERAKSSDLLQAVSSEILEETIPSHLKDADNHWFGLTKRARVIAYAKDRVDESELSTYEDLASDKWNDKLLIRSSGNIYNQSLMASIMVHNGEEEAKEWAEAVVENMARAPKGNDRDQVKAVVAGEGDLAIVNTYYIGKMLNSEDPEEVKAGEEVKLFFPNQEGRGTHINVSGAGVAKYAPNKENAIKFIEFLISEEAQKIFAHSNYEYPVNEAVTPAALLQEWGEFKEDTLNLSTLGENNKKAVMLFDEAGWK
ncbi:Fe(3+) ABC transporter substrate-binding protein [Salegentibacter sp. JZCK2]|uniref:Fe(3+) ABC transporter substrate-binding protein n=1 Tax=Salegentibacter tibetensis TaxID=2873600 RepID=UPI001CC957EF|nr:Fe(3+) ABC transporter substrate-binding protein [Salegentibacter tibetensis]MBZ9730133.1 Fe(3+) ABC transporter substrate-binding protein [Salegentibacter tibetensis]